MARGKPQGNRGFFIAFEGGEGAGKTTQMRRLAIQLRKTGYPVILTLQPGGTSIGRKVRRLLLDTRSGHLSPRAELLLYTADRAQHVDELVLPALRAGKVVISDRYADSSTVYQGICRGLGEKWTVTLNAFATDGLSPDITFVLDLPEDMGLARVKKRRAKMDRLEREARAFHRKVRAGFLKLARKDPRRRVVIDATRGEEEIAADIQSAVFRRLRAPNRTSFVARQVPSPADEDAQGSPRRRAHRGTSRTATAEDEARREKALVAVERGAVRRSKKGRR